MFAFFTPRQTAKAVRAVAVCLLAAIGASCAGCANNGTSFPNGPAPSVYVAQGPSVPTESDGLPVQAAPPSTIRQMPDDPTQPYSPNYGGTNPASTLQKPPTVKASNEVPPIRPSVPADLPPAFRKQLVAAIDVDG